MEEIREREDNAITVHIQNLKNKFILYIQHK